MRFPIFLSMMNVTDGTLFPQSDYFPETDHFPETNYLHFPKNDDFPENGVKTLFTLISSILLHFYALILPKNAFFIRKYIF